MGKLLLTCLSPHPPIIVHEVGHGEEQKIQKTIDSLYKLSDDIAKLYPDTVIVMSPHAYVFSDAVSVDLQKELSGDLGQFGANTIKMNFQNDLELTYIIASKTKQIGIPIAEIDDAALLRFHLSKDLDHGTIVPLYFVTKKYNKFKLIRMSYGFLPFEELYEFGSIIGKSIRESTKNVIFIASGDLSHKLNRNSPNGYTPNGKIFDELILDLLKKMNAKEIINMDKGLIEDAAECGFRSICVMLGVLDGYNTTSNVMSHEGPFGVGYGVVEFIPKEYTGKSLIGELYDIRREKIESKRKNEDIYIKLARESLEYYIENRVKMKVPQNLPSELLINKAGVFVSLHKDGELRGCIGTIYPQGENIADEIIRNAISAGTEDPRFYPVDKGELKDIEYSVDILSKPERIKSIDLLDPKKYGVIVKRGYKSGVLLPDLDGVDSVSEQISIALKKAGISPSEQYELERFEVVRHK